MPFQNRVLATGEIIADPARGLMLGNRGILHNDQQQLGNARWRHKNWVCCVLEFKNRRRRIMSPGTYTELFFLDEAVALAAGHRPCAECRRSAYVSYRTALGFTGSAKALDEQLHAERAVPRVYGQRRQKADLTTLPNGTVIMYGDAPYLVQDTTLRLVTPSGYRAPVERPRRADVMVITPPTSRAALSNGYPILLHPSAHDHT